MHLHASQWCYWLIQKTFLQDFLEVMFPVRELVLGCLLVWIGVNSKVGDGDGSFIPNF